MHHNYTNGIANYSQCSLTELAVVLDALYDCGLRLIKNWNSWMCIEYTARPAVEWAGISAL